MPSFELVRTETDRLVAQEILEVFYAPHRAFKKIVQNPKFLGPLLIVVIFVAVQVGSSYVIASRSYLEQTMPTSEQGDVWTESASFWQENAGVTVAINTVDFINSSSLYLNNTSIEFTADNTSSIQVFLNDFGESVNCGADGFQNLSVRVKIASPASAPENVTLYLFSLSPANFFVYDLTQEFSNTTIAEQHFWNNLTIPVDTADWTSSNSAATWGNITGLRMDFAWQSDSSVDLLVDGLFFRGIYTSSLDLYGNSVLISSALGAATPFLFQWLLLTGLMYLLIKGLKGSVVWKPVMVAVGFALVTLVVQSIILLGVYAAMLPDLTYSLEFIAGVPGEADMASQALQTTIAQVLQIGSALQVAVYVWIIALGAFITREVTATAPASPEVEGMPSFQQFGWSKCLLVSGASFLLTLLILGFLGIG
jgi:hypothetical protein